MYRNSEEGLSENQIFIKGDIDKIKIDRNGPIPNIGFHPSSLSKAKNGTKINPLKIYSQDNVLAAIDGTSFPTQTMTRDGSSLSSSISQLTCQNWSKRR